MSISAGEFARWIARREGSAVEVIRGLRGKLQPGALNDRDIAPGDPIRAGGYGEDRGLYTQKLFAPAGEEPRTVHLGIDVFAPEHAEVFAPLDGRVHSFRDNANPGDYGPTIILEHQIDGAAFHTLYGHLSRASLAGLGSGKMVAAGERIAWLGGRSENGGWPPHLHFQVILDMKGMSGDYPGVCRRSEREHWLSVCPDPGPLLGLIPA